jgi:hypothetical protein
MDRIVITIRPAPSDANLLSATDAMRQVIDTLKILSEAEQSFGSPHEAFQWKLESASTNSPLRIVLLAESVNPTVDVSAHVRRVKTEVSRGVLALVSQRAAAPWMKADVLKTMQGMLRRNVNGIGITEIDFETDDAPIALDKAQAEIGLSAIEGLNATDSTDQPAREAWGEVPGVVVAAGRYKGRPAIQIRTEIYGFVWCILSTGLIKKFGDEQKLAEVWRDKMVGVVGVLDYQEGGRLGRIDAQQIRDIDTHEVPLSKILDRDFTAGLEPHDYLDQFHAGELA